MHQRRLHSILSLSRRLKSSKENAEVTYSVPARGPRPPHHAARAPLKRQNYSFPVFPVIETMHQRRLHSILSLSRRLKSSKENAEVTYSVPARGPRPPHHAARAPLKRQNYSFPVFPNRGVESGMAQRLYDYQVMSELVQSLPTASERIEFVNPYEREFTRREIRFHRPWQARLLKTRKAWRVESVPNYFDPLNFYQYITKTRCIEGLSQWYNEPALPFSRDFKQRLGEMLRLHLLSTNVESEEERVNGILRSLLDLLLEHGVQSRVHTALAEQRVSHAPRCESFWIRSGFDAIYEKSNKHRHRGDDRAKLGELAFTLRDAFATHVRLKRPLKPQRLGEMLRLHLLSTNVESEEERVDGILRSLLDLLLEHGVQSRVHTALAEQRVSHAPRCESFWIRSGFDAIYEKSNRHRHRGDDRAKLGELAFTLRDAFATHVRLKRPLKPLLPFSDEEVTRPLFEPEFNVKDEVIYSPAMFGMLVDSEPLWQCPGYEPDSGDEYKFGLVAFKQCTELDDYCKRWKVRGEEERVVRNECLRATAVSSLFSWLNGQAHALGFTQYNDIENPLVSQLVLSDGKQFFFAIAQLNTLLINVDIEGIINKRVNLCYVEGPFNLYNEYNHSFTQYNDIENPLVSQLVLSDGKQFFFAIAQLNTLLINVDIEGIINKRVNLCYVEGPFNLYDEYNHSTGMFHFHQKSGSDEAGNQFNLHVLGRLMQMIVRDIPVRDESEDIEQLPKYVPVTFESVP
ncbi:unnamed protein product [Gongylonema pulchrum]|uniref:Uncharacterized protein n=1 Tax=Gongylonema pulchrum TaxID=637853 RepID=A0A183DT55_9BILA|nr:unnamed protein product [Gongylonema pulchrum]